MEHLNARRMADEVEAVYRLATGGASDLPETGSGMIDGLSVGAAVRAPVGADGATTLARSCVLEASIRAERPWPPPLSPWPRRRAVLSAGQVRARVAAPQRTRRHRPRFR